MLALTWSRTRTARRPAQARRLAAYGDGSSNGARPDQPVGRWLVRALLIGLLALPLGLLGAGFLVEGAQPPLERSDVIVVISGDEDMARLRAGLDLWRQAWAPRLLFSGAAREGPVSNAEAMRNLALAEGVPAEVILLDEHGENTYGNAVQTRRVMESHGLRSAILVTSPYHLQRAAVTFNGVFRGSDIRLIASAAPDSDWRKLTWWRRADLRLLTLSELQKLGYILLTGRYT